MSGQFGITVSGLGSFSLNDSEQESVRQGIFNAALNEVNRVLRARGQAEINSSRSSGQEFSNDGHGQWNYS